MLPRHPQGVCRGAYASYTRSAFWLFAIWCSGYCHRDKYEWQSVLSQHFYRKSFLMNQRENQADFGSRLRWVRKKHDLTLEKLARRLGVTRSYLSKLEAGKSDNPSELLTSMICQTYCVRRDWLLRGHGQPFEAEYLNLAARSGEVIGFQIPHPATIEERAKELGLFIAALMMAGGQSSPDFLLAALIEVLSNPLPLPSVTIEVSRLLAEQLRFCLKTNPSADSAPPAVRSIQSILAEGTIARNSYDRLLQDALAENNMLTGVAALVTMPPVKSQLKTLLERVNGLISKGGKQTELADFLGATPASVSRWLSGKREPGGETTLRLLKWVELQERNTK
jgi:transcriptional regulator with XRE-family HTH domain